MDNSAHESDAAPSAATGRDAPEVALRKPRWRRPAGLALLAVVAVVGSVLGATTVLQPGRPGHDRVEADPLITTTTQPPETTTVAVTAPATVAPSTAPPTTARPAPKRPVVSRPVAPVAFRGLGTWADVYDWSATFTNGKPRFGPDDVDRMAAQGVQTLYIQTAHADVPGPVLEPDRLLPIIARARQRGVRVVGWYLPNLQDVGADLQRLVAIARLGADGIGVDIESRAVSDVAARNDRLVALSRRLRAAAPGRAIGAIVLPPTLTEVVNPAYWPSFPWRAIAPFYDVWLPMAYWSVRSNASGYRDGYRYVADSIIRLRNDLGQPLAPVHAIGGIADQVDASATRRFVAAVRATNSAGGSLYDWRTTAPTLWASLRSLRS